MLSRPPEVAASFIVGSLAAGTGVSVLAFQPPRARKCGRRGEVFRCPELAPFAIAIGPPFQKMTPGPY